MRTFNQIDNNRECNCSDMPESSREAVQVNLLGWSNANAAMMVLKQPVLYCVRRTRISV